MKIRSSSSKKTKYPWIVWLVFPAIIILVGVFIYQVSLKKTKVINFYSSRITSWLTEHKSQLKTKLPNIKHMTKKSDPEPKIHFEFYTALPNMQVTAANNTEKDILPKKPNIKRSVTKIVEANELEQQLANELHQKL